MGNSTTNFPDGHGWTKTQKFHRPREALRFVIPRQLRLRSAASKRRYFAIASGDRDRYVLRRSRRVMYFGVDYYPEHWVYPYDGSPEQPEARWERDLELMIAAGINVVR